MHWAPTSARHCLILLHLFVTFDTNNHPEALFPCIQTSLQWRLPIKESSCLPTPYTAIVPRVLSSTVALPAWHTLFWWCDLLAWGQIPLICWRFLNLFIYFYSLFWVPDFYVQLPIGHYSPERCKVTSNSIYPMFGGYWISSLWRQVCKEMRVANFGKRIVKSNGLWNLAQ